MPIPQTREAVLRRKEMEIQEVSLRADLEMEELTAMTLLNDLISVLISEIFRRDALLRQWREGMIALVLSRDETAGRSAITLEETQDLDCLRSAGLDELVLRGLETRQRREITGSYLSVLQHLQAIRTHCFAEHAARRAIEETEGTARRELPVFAMEVSNRDSIVTQCISSFFAFLAAAEASVRAIVETAESRSWGRLYNEFDEATAAAQEASCSFISLEPSHPTTVSAPDPAFFRAHELESFLRRPGREPREDRLMERVFARNRVATPSTLSSEIGSADSPPLFGTTLMRRIHSPSTSQLDLLPTQSQAQSRPLAPLRANVPERQAQALLCALMDSGTGTLRPALPGSQQVSQTDVLNTLVDSVTERQNQGQDRSASAPIPSFLLPATTKRPLTRGSDATFRADPQLRHLLPLPRQYGR
eukprot:TRINITY_DN9434_c0_g1_i2.p1 TRINITY_DN9434_c0_g1~~TRINITY_DN9434_c0_g1_i2.p1  ORF type:complete len:420 (+),score=34.97 TRINITY_DN9434_c0_g1_i2:103-1362(+)